MPHPLTDRFSWPKKGYFLLGIAVIFLAIDVFICRNSSEKYGIISRLIGWTRTDHITIEHKSLQFVASSEEEIRANYKLSNSTSKPIKILGSKVSCSCTRLGDLPMILPSNGTLDLPVLIAAPRSGGFFGTIELYTDDVQIPILELSFTGQVDRMKESGPAILLDTADKDQAH